MPDLLESYVKSKSARKQPATSEPSSSPTSLLRSIAGTVLSPLAMAGNVLDLPGSSVRDALVGSNPFDQWLTPVSSDNRTTGRELARTLGMAGNKDTWGNFLGGLALEVGTDPLTFMSGGASGIGKALLGTGKATHLAKIGIPFTRAEMKIGAKAAKGLDNLASKAWSTKTGQGIKSAARGLFDYRVKGSFDPAVQKFNTAATEAAERKIPESTLLAMQHRSALAPARDLFYKEMSHLPEKEVAVAWDRVLHHTQEVAKHGDYQRAFSDAVKEISGNVPSGELVNLAATPIKNIVDARSALYSANRAKGVKGGWIEHPEMQHAPRAGNKELLESSGKKLTGEGMFHNEFLNERSPALAHIPQHYLDKMIANPGRYGGKLGAANILDDFHKYLGFERKGKRFRLRDKRLNQETLKAIQKDSWRYLEPQNLLDDFGDKLGYELKKSGEVVPVSPIDHAIKLSKQLQKIHVAPNRHAEMLAKKIEGISGKFSSFHELNPAGLHQKYMESSARIGANVDAVHQALKESLGHPAGIKLKDAFTKIGLDPKRATEHFGTLTGISGKELKKAVVDPAVVESIVRSKKTFALPEGIEFLGGMLDKFNKTFKGSVTLPFPSFHIRNLISGQHMNLASEHLKTADDFVKYAEKAGEAFQLRHAGELDPRIQEMMAYGLLDPWKAFEDVDIPHANTLQSRSVNPYKLGKAAWGQAGEHVAENPAGTWAFGLDAKIPKRLRQAMNTPMQAGGNVARAAEFMNRVPMYLYLRDKGFGPLDAVREVEKLQFNYGKMSPTEKLIGRRLIPFYGFSRNVTPQIAQMLAEHPGGKMAQTIRAANSGREREDILPSHIADEAAIPLGTREDGTKRYMTGFGLAPEAAMPYLMAPADFKGAGLNFLSSMTPPLKYLLENATGQTFFQRGMDGGRPLGELDPTIGRTISNVLGMQQPVNIAHDRDTSRAVEHLLANLPSSKVTMTARMLSDPRKTALEKLNNFVSPMRITDVSPQQQERLLQQASNVMADKLGAKSWKNRYFPQDVVEYAEKTNPQAADEMKALNALWKEAKRNAVKYQNKNITEQKKPASKKSGDRAVRELFEMIK